MHPLSRSRLCVATASIAVVTGGTAEAGFEVHGPVVAHGRSPHGVPWKIKAQRDNRASFTVEFDFDPPAYSDVGYVGSGTFAGLRKGVIAAVTGSDFSPYPESDLSGIAHRRAVTLLVKLNRGPQLEIHPQLAPRRIRTRFPWLRRMRFFDRFFAADRVPKVVTALDVGGHVLARRHSDRGAF